jgi:pimeloyl-ACP methyl ester carboxylesterase
MKVTSTHGVDVTVHELAPDPGPGSPILMMSHATGFHGRCFEPMAAILADRFWCWAPDYRGHGATDAPTDIDLVWEHYGDDATAVAKALTALDPSRAVIGVGHSMGGACLLMVAHREPGLLSGSVLFEPIVFPPHGASDPKDNPLVAGARRRRRHFDSLEEAEANYGAKRPMSTFAPEALRAYVAGGLRPDPEGGFVLACEPEHEARTFETGGTHRTWEVLEEITTPAWVVAGRLDAAQPSRLAADIAARLPAGSYVQMDDLDHFGPMTHPERIADLVIGLADSVLRGRH